MNALSRIAEPNIRPDCTDELTAALRQRIMVIDGAMGTAIQRDRPDEAGYRGERFTEWPTALQGNNDLLTLTQPQIIEGIHREYLEAGADILETNTFNANAVSLSDYDMARAGLRAELRRRRPGPHGLPTSSAPRRSPATSPAPSGRRRGPRRSRRTSTTPEPATSPTTSWSPPTSKLPTAWSTVVPTSSSSRRSSTR